MTSGVIVKSWEKLQLESRLKTSTFTFHLLHCCLHFHIISIHIGIMSFLSPSLKWFIACTCALTLRTRDDYVILFYFIYHLFVLSFYLFIYRYIIFFEGAMGMECKRILFTSMSHPVCCPLFGIILLTLPLSFRRVSSGILALPRFILTNLMTSSNKNVSS